MSFGNYCNSQADCVSGSTCTNNVCVDVGDVATRQPSNMQVTVANGTAGNLTVYQMPYDPANPKITGVLLSQRVHTYSAPASASTFGLYVVASTCSNTGQFNVANTAGVQYTFDVRPNADGSCTFQLLGPRTVPNDLMGNGGSISQSTTVKGGLNWLWWVLLIVIILLILWWVYRSSKLTVPTIE